MERLGFSAASVPVLKVFRSIRTEPWPRSSMSQFHSRVR